MDIFFDIFKGILIAVIIMLVLVGLAFISSDFSNMKNVVYVENGIELDAIQYQNKIYLYKGE